MNRKLSLAVFAVLTLIGLLFSSAQVIISLGFCESINDVSCLSNILGVGQPVLLLGFSIVLVNFVLLFLNQAIFKSWSRFAMVAIPLAVIWIALTPVQSGSSAIAGLGVADTRESVTWIASIAFFAISLLIILVKSLKIKNTR